MILNSLFAPLSWIWETIYFVRRFLYTTGVFPRNFFSIPVVSIGNLTFGGTGKTPFVIWLNNYLHQHSKKALILTRGYKGDYEHKSALIFGNERFRFNPTEYGDEALLISRRLGNSALAIGKNRTANLKKYFSKVMPDMAILDDGIQHLKIYSDLNIALFDATLPIEKYKVAPRGFLREGLSALRDVDMVIISRVDQVDEVKKNHLYSFLKKYINANTEIGEMIYSPKGLYNLQFQKVEDVSFLNGKKVICAAALASPHSFFNLVRSMGAEVVQEVVYPDHYFFHDIDIEHLLKLSKTHNCPIIVSEKDVVKIRRLTNDQNFLYVEVDINFLKGENELKFYLEKLLSRG